MDSIEEFMNSIKFKIEEVPDSTNFWLIRTNGGLFYDEYKQNNVISLGWNNIDEEKINKLYKIKNKNQFKKSRDSLIEDISNIWGTDKRLSSLILNKTYRFINEMKENDIIMFPNKGSSEVVFAKVGNYFERDISSEKELEVLKQIKSKQFDFLDLRCPFKKCRNIEIINVVPNDKIHPKLFRALISRHGISDINEYSEFVLSSIYTAYVWKNRINLRISIQQEGRIKGYEYSFLMYTIANLVKDSNANLEFTTRSNLNSKGLVELSFALINGAVDILKDRCVLFILMAIIIVVCGGKYGKFECNSILERISKFRQDNIKIKKDKIELENSELNKKSLEEDLRKKKLDNDIKELEYKLKLKEIDSAISAVDQQEVNNAVHVLDINTEEISNVIQMPTNRDLERNNDN